MDSVDVKIQVAEGGKIPIRATSGSAGYDIYSSENKTIPSYDRRLISTGIRIACPPGYYARIAPRSGLALRGIDVAAGVVDSDYRGEVKVLLVNSTDDSFQVNRGDRIAQMIFEKIGKIEFVEGNVDGSSRGEGGFGSTGK